MNIDTTSYRSPNYSNRPWGGIQGITLHTGEGTRQSDLDWLCNARSQVSAHYYVCRNGDTCQMVSDHKAAWHAGHVWGNNHTIGIETEHRQGQDWPDLQRTTLAQLCRMLINEYGIPESGIVAHRWLTPSRKIDPTDWPDPELRQWIAALYEAEERPEPPAPALEPGRFITVWPATVRTDYTVKAPIVMTLMPGHEVEVDAWKENKDTSGRGVGWWAHWETGLGFVHESALERMK